jgi:2-iminobutanoate/2-iminopropanoate deaminase
MDKILKIDTPLAPRPVAAYSQAVIFNNIVYVSGQIGLDPVTNQLVSEDISSQTTHIFANIKAILNAANSDFENLLRIEIFITDILEFSKINDIYDSYLSEIKPARQTVEVSALPLNAKIEISCIAAIN